MARGLSLDAALAASLAGPAADWHAKVTWLMEQGAELLEGDGGADYDGIAQAASRKVISDSMAVERFTWLKGQNYLFSIDHDYFGLQPIELVAAAGCPAAVAWLLEQDATPMTADVSSGIILPCELDDKHLGVLQALKAAGFLQLRDFVHGAAAGGAMAVLEWAWEEWDWAAVGGLTCRLLYYGAQSGSVEVMRWLLQRGCPMAELAWVKAAESGCEAAVELLAELGCPMPACGLPYMVAIGQPGLSHGREWRMLPLLRKAGVPFGPSSQGIFTRAVSRGTPIATLEWLLAEGCCVDWGEAERAAGGLGEGAHASEVTAWIKEQREGEGEEEA